MKFIIVTPTGEQSYSVEHITAETPAGSLVIKRGHAPLITTLLPHTTLEYSLRTGEQQSIALTRPGFLEISRTHVVALINQ